MDAIAPTDGCPGCAALAAEVAELRRQVAELKALLKRDSSNSSQPPSSDGPGGPPRAGKGPTGRRRGGQPGHRGHHRRLLPPERVDHVVLHLPGSCRHCHAPLDEQAGPDDPPPHRHQVAELPPLAAVITEHQGHARVCGCCGAVTRRPIPPPVLAHTLGPRLSALMSYLSGRCHDGRRVVLEFVNDVLGVPASLGTVCARERETAAALEQACRQVSRVVRGAASKNVDETGWKQAGRRRWLWVAAAKKAALFAIHPRRGWDGLRSVLGADPGRTGGGRGVVGCDRFPTYEPIPDRNRQLCWAHLLREFRKWSEPGGHSTAAMDMGEQGLGIAQRVLGLWRDFRARSLTGRRTLRRKASELKKGLATLLRRGSRLRRRRDLKAARFCAKVLARRASLWTFLRAPDVEPTNNHAERCLRPAVLWRKNSFGCDSDGGCRFAERILTVVTTLRLRGRRVLDYLQRALECHRAELPAPSIFA